MTKLYSEKLKEFTAAHPSEILTVDGAEYRYVLSGKKDGETLVLLNGGMNTLEMWMNYVDPLSRDFRVLLFDYPQELRTNQELVTGMHAFFAKLGVERPVFVGASDGRYGGTDLCAEIPRRDWRPCSDLYRRYGGRDA